MVGAGVGHRCLLLSFYAACLLASPATAGTLVEYSIRNGGEKPAGAAVRTEAPRGNTLAAAAGGAPGGQAADVARAISAGLKALAPQGDAVSAASFDPSVSIVGVKAYTGMASGQTYSAFASFLEDKPELLVDEKFSLVFALFTIPTLDRFGASKNGVNPFDVALTVLPNSADPRQYAAFAVAAGAMDWASNSGGHGVVSNLLDRGYGASDYNTRVDYVRTATVTRNGATTTTFSIDTSKGISGGLARTDRLNWLRPGRSPVGNVYKVIQGRLRITIRGARLTGSYDFRGTQQTSPGVARATGKLSGSLLVI